MLVHALAAPARLSLAPLIKATNPSLMTTRWARALSSPVLLTQPLTVLSLLIKRRPSTKYQRNSSDSGWYLPALVSALEVLISLRLRLKGDVIIYNKE